MNKATRLARLIERLTNESGVYQTDIAGLSLTHFSAPDPPRHTIENPVLCVVAQGKISVFMPGEVHTHGPSHYLVMALDLPMIAEIVGASRAAPYLGVTLALDLNELSELSLSDVPSPAPANAAEKGLFFGEVDNHLSDAVYRLVGLLTRPEEIPTLAPLIRREIFYRLLSGNQSSLFRNLAIEKGQLWRIARIVDWMKKNYTDSFKIEDLARRANMSVASLHYWFKTVTTLSPLQFQKRLRLQEARRMLYRDGAAATTVGLRVGYESPSHFNRDYSRLFGAPPLRDMERMRSVSGGINGVPRVLPSAQKQSSPARRRTR